MALNTQTTNAFYVIPIRGITGPNFLYYNNINGEITYSHFVSGQLINTKIITQSINANSFNGLNPSRSPGVMGNTPIVNATVTYSIAYNISNIVPTNSIISIDIDLPYNYSGSDEDYITVSIQDPIDITIFEKVQWWGGSGGAGTRSGTIFPLSCSYQLTGSQSQNRLIILKIQNNGNDTINLFSKRLNNNINDITPLEKLSIKISEYQA